MTRQVSAQRQIQAVPAVIYRIIADYHEGHRRIVSPKAFRWLAVEAGGTGAGTRIRFGMRAFGRTRTVTGVVSEPDPGRILVEHYPESGVVTTFTVEPVMAGESASVTIATVIPVRGGVLGRAGGFLAERYLRPLYEEELQRLADEAEGRRRHDPVPRQKGG